MKRHASGKWSCLAIVAVLLCSAVSGMICWKLSAHLATKSAQEDRTAYMEQYNAAHSSTYQRLNDSWTQTLAELYADSVFFGDLLTASGLWAEYYPYMATINLGVVGDTVDGLLLRLNQVEIL
ncbi:MAG: hypothetical protein E7319_11225 [Clostridiales bacterium]|nr:hypothetical protein [Clostridiales bacterium]